ncbi:uncharacterized protein L201_000873 [Kwoniella dendrophila CBS 6074]|uniref:DUF6604 domain-containing protein n=1 Tax=Kwoniella dendrophila CBS 6074 TaxID=1295534 RepID=A0AAX4JKR7_9TREE
MQLLNRCISLRYRCLKRFLKIPGASTQSHAHFIDVLNGVYNTFVVHLKQMASSTDESTKTFTYKSTQNRFAELESKQEDEVEDLPDIYLPEPPCPPSATPARIRCTPEPDQEELIIRVLAFFEDMHDIRDEIVAIWERYKSRQIDLITASVTTNTALELLKKPNEDIVKHVLPAFGGDFRLVIAILYNILTMPHTGRLNRQIVNFNLINDNDILNTTIYDHLLLPLNQLLHGMSDVIVDGFAPIYRPGHYGQYNPNLDFHNVPVSQRWHQSQILICESFTDYFLLGNLGDRQGAIPSAPVVGDEKNTNLFFIDEITTEMSHFSKTKKPTLLLIIYCQIFVDINLVLGSDAKRGVSELVQGATDMLKTFDRRKQHEVQPPNGTWPKENEMIVDIFRHELDIWKTMTPQRQMYSIVPNHMSVQLSLFERDPMLCGLVLFRLRMKYQQLGLTLVNAYGAVLSTAHLYTACKNSGVEPGQPFPDWPDMNMVIELHGKEDIFGGKFPRTIDDSNASRHVFDEKKNLPSNLRNRKSKPPLASKSGPKGLEDHTQLLPLFLSKYVRDPSAGTTFSINTIDTLQTDVTMDRIKSEEDENSRFYSQNKTIIRHKRKHKSPKMSILQVLSILEAGLISESTSIRFDYISFHLRCLKVLKQVQLSAHDYFMMKIGPGYQENDSQLSFITGWILRFAANSGQAAEALGIKREGRNASLVQSRRLVDATRVIKEFLSKTGEGDTEIKKIGL